MFIVSTSKGKNLVAVVAILKYCSYIFKSIVRKLNLILKSNKKKTWRRLAESVRKILQG